jgi:hypothetical protein
MANMPGIATIINDVFPPLYPNSKTKHGISTSIRLARKACDEGSPTRRTITRMHESLSTSPRSPVGMDKGGIQIGHLRAAKDLNPFMGVNVHIYVQSPMPTLYHNPENLQETDLMNQNIGEYGGSNTFGWWTVRQKMIHAVAGRFYPSGLATRPKGTCAGDLDPFGLSPQGRCAYGRNHQCLWAV